MYSVVLAMALVGGADAVECCGCFGGGWGGCYGGGCYGGGCYGGACYGRGCYGGGCYGGGCYGGGCYGGGCYGGGCYGYGRTGYYSASPYPAVPVYYAQAPVITQPTTGTIVVSLPASAKLTIDGFVSQQTTSQRRLQTPAIPQGKQLTYTLVAETMRDGQLVTQTQTVNVRAGQEIPVQFNFSTATAER